MFELIEHEPAVRVDEAEYRRLLGYPRGHKLAGRARELADTTSAWFATHGRPWVYAREVESLKVDAGSVWIEGIEFISPAVRDALVTADAHSMVLLAVSAGRECEEQAGQLWREGKPDEYFFLEMYGSAVVEHLVMRTGASLCDRAERNSQSVLPHYSPGYAGWDVSEQSKLLNLIVKGAKAGLPGELSAFDTGMLRPKKSLLAVFGVTRHVKAVRPPGRLVPCENCSYAPCQYRRAAYIHAPPQIENVRRLQGVEADVDAAPEPTAFPLTRQARYTVNARALRRWSEERLALIPLDDGSVEARFRYDGTTCSNLGQALAFDYRVTLSSAETGHRILDLSCRPAPGDTGCAKQCEYLNQGPALLETIAAEKPLLGRSLDDVLTWSRPFAPSGCYCDVDRRAHKWGLVYEVIHFALVRRETDAAIFSIPTNSI